MIEERLVQLIDESIRLEQNVASLYRLFAHSIPVDHDFWQQLHLEEKSHAMLLRSARDSFIKRGQFPQAIVADSLRDLKSSNEKTEAAIRKFTEQPPGRHAACEAAIALEQQAGEIHFMQFMEKEAANALETVFQQLNRGDKDHERRIIAHLNALREAT